MGMHIKIRQKPDTDYMKLDKKLKIARIIAKEFNLKIKNWEIWKDNIAESIGGKKLKTINFDSEIPHEFARKYDLNKIIIYGKGVLNIPNRIILSNSDNDEDVVTHLPARMIIYNNKSLRSLYFDYDIDTGDLPLHLLLEKGVYNDDNLSTIIHNIRDNLKALGAHIEKIMVVDDPLSLKIIYNRYFSFFDDIKTFLEDFFSSLKRTSEIPNNNDMYIKYIVSLIEPYDTGYFANVVANELYKNNEYLNKISRMSKVRISYSSIILYGPEKIDALYKNLIQDFNEKVIKNLPEKKKIDSILKGWVK